MFGLKDLSWCCATFGESLFLLKISEIKISFGSERIFLGLMDDTPRIVPLIMSWCSPKMQKKKASLRIGFQQKGVKLKNEINGCSKTG